MRNLKKFLALVLASLMVFSAAVITTGAADDADYTDAAQHLAALKILKGDEKGNLNLGNGVTRWQAALFFVQALTGTTDAAVWNANKSVNFNDVPEYGTAIDYAYGTGIIIGRGNGVYGYSDAITYRDMLVMAVRALGYETEDMVYPYGYIMAAQKLGLTENIKKVDFTAALTRGETAQLIWNMLNTEVAYIDPLSGKVVYPDETGLLEILLPGDEDIIRTTLLQESGFADAELNGTVVEFLPADEDEETEAMVVVDVDGDEITVKAADLGITADTAKVTYMGLPVTIFVDCAAEDFAEKYEEGEASVVFANYETYTTVENLGDAGNIKVVVNAEDANKTYVSLGGVKFTNKDYYVVLKTWNDAEGIWTTATDTEWNNAFASFVYANGKYVGRSEANPYPAAETALNTYGKVAYRVTDETIDEKVVVEALYTPYSFGQYNVLTLKDAATSKNAEYATYTTGVSGATKLFGSDVVVNKSTPSVGATVGEAAKTVTVEGEEIASGDFMFYSYNKADNVLTVAQNCGTYTTGRLTSFNATKQTVKISGVNYDFGSVAGLYTVPGAASFNATTAGNYMNALETGKDNVKYLVINGSIVALGTPDAETGATYGAYDYAIVTTVPSVIAAIKDVEVEELALTEDGLLLENGYVTVAVLNTEDGQWELASVETLALTFNNTTGKFSNAVDVATLASFADMGILAEAKAAQYEAAAAEIVSGVFAVLEENDGVYDLGIPTTYGLVAPDATDLETYPAGESDEAYLEDLAAYNAAVAAVDPYAPFVTAPMTNGLLFNTTGQTSMINIPGTYDETTGTWDQSRFLPLLKSVIVVVSENGVGVRVGITTNAKFNIAPSNGVVLTATSNLIVVATGEEWSATNSLEVADWSEGSNANATVRYNWSTEVAFILPSSEITVEVDEDGETYYQITNLVGLRRIHKDMSPVFTGVSYNDFVLTLQPGDVIYFPNNINDIYQSGHYTKHKVIFKDNDELREAAGETPFYNDNEVSSTSSDRTDWFKFAISIMGWSADGTNTTPLTGDTLADSVYFTEDSINILKKDGSVAWSASNPVSETKQWYVVHMNASKLDATEYDFSKMVLADTIGLYEEDADTGAIAFDASGAPVVSDAYTNALADGYTLVPAGTSGIQQYYYVRFEFSEEDNMFDLTAPLAGVMDNQIIAASGKTILVPLMGADDYTGAAEVVLNNVFGYQLQAHDDHGAANAVGIFFTSILSDADRQDAYLDPSVE